MLDKPKGERKCGKTQKKRLLKKKEGRVVVRRSIYVQLTGGEWGREKVSR